LPDVPATTAVSARSPVVPAVPALPGDPPPQPAIASKQRGTNEANMTGTQKRGVHGGPPKAERQGSSREAELSSIPRDAICFAR
jgi:hypothetical protein